MKTTILMFVAVAMLLAPRAAAAQGFIVPFLGWNFGGDAKCLEITGCEENTSITAWRFGALGPVFWVRGGVRLLEGLLRRGA